MAMTLNRLASMIAKAEGKKHQASIGDIREILKIIIEIGAKHTELGYFLTTKMDNQFWINRERSLQNLIKNQQLKEKQKNVRRKK